MKYLLFSLLSLSAIAGRAQTYQQLHGPGGDPDIKVRLFMMIMERQDSQIAALSTRIDGLENLAHFNTHQFNRYIDSFKSRMDSFSNAMKDVLHLGIGYPRSPGWNITTAQADSFMHPLTITIDSAAIWPVDSVKWRVDTIPPGTYVTNMGNDSAWWPDTCGKCIDIWNTAEVMSWNTAKLAGWTRAIKIGDAIYMVHHRQKHYWLTREEGKK